MIEANQPNPHPALQRKDAVEALIAKYQGRSFDWRSGCTCVHLARFHLRQMGHRPPTLPRLRSALAAKREMQRRGWADVGAMLDAIGLERIAPAQMVLGDLAVGPADEFFGAIGVCAGPLGQLLGWHEDQPGLVIIHTDLSQLTGAWRV